MCGIYAYVGTRQDAGDIILDGLRSLEYRGYDSWGVAIKSIDGSVVVRKKPGKIGDNTMDKASSTIGIGHTRWATHGGVTESNAHPHIDCSGEVVIVHNGIVENFETLKNDLLKKGHVFGSQTDTEVIAHLIEEKRKTEKDMKKIMSDVFHEIGGMNAIIAFLPGSEEIYAVKNGSPLVIGQSSDEYILASDSSAILPYTNSVYFMEDNEMLIVSREGFKLMDEVGKDTDIAFTKLQYGSEAVKLGTFQHYMMKEIHEQPAVMKTILDQQLDDIRTIADVIKHAYGTYFVGCGTASYAGLAGTYLFSKIAKRHVNAAVASEFAYLTDFLKDTSLVVALSQSGETIDVISCIKEAKRKGSKVLAMTNVNGSTLYRQAHYRLLLNAGPEKAVVSTKAYTAKITMLYLLAHAVAGTLDTGVQTMRKAITQTEAIIQSPLIAGIAEKLETARDVFVLGRGVSYAAALEAALKVKETSYVHAEGFAAGELKHGVIALIEPGTPVLVFNPSDETYDDTLSSAHEVKARGAYIIGISDKPNPVYDEYIEVGDCSEATLIPNVVIAQLIGYWLALSKGYDPDKPRNLAKSVTVK